MFTRPKMEYTFKVENSQSGSRNLWDVIKHRKIVLLVGSGGVGKTTISATIALQAAMAGKKVLAVTIDPAKRLANSMGLKEVGNVAKRVVLEPLEEKNGSVGELWIMMLDIKRSLDELIINYAPSKEISDRILSNNVYKAVSDSLAGTEEIVTVPLLSNHGGIMSPLIIKRVGFSMIRISLTPPPCSIRVPHLRLLPPCDF